LVVLSRGATAEDVRRAQQVGFELLEGELRHGRNPVRGRVRGGGLETPAGRGSTPRFDSPPNTPGRIGSPAALVRDPAPPCPGGHTPDSHTRPRAGPSPRRTD